MKKSFLFVTLVLMGVFALSQTPQAFKYQTVARNNAGEILANQNISFRMTILQGELPGIVVYAETHAATTNATGLATLEIGRGTPVSGNFAAINWSTTPIFLKTEIDPAGGSAFVEMGTSELLSVPYALYAENTANNDDADADPANELQTLTQNGLNVSLSQGGGTINVADNDNNPANEIQQLIKAGNVVTLSQNGGSFTDEVNDADANPTNELQNLSNSKNGNLINLEISNGMGTTLDVTDSDANPVNELQILTQTDYQVTMSQGGGSITTGLKSYTQAEINAMMPYDGLTVYNSTTHCINFYTVNNWFESCGTCIPQPSQANAGEDQCFTDATISVFLAANTPLSGDGLWTIISGDGGTFENANNPNSGFTGQACEQYVLMWSITTSCGSSSDNVNIGFNYLPTTPNAGPDQLGIGGNTATLSANTPVDGTGLWEIIIGEGGTLGDPTAPNSTFTGIPTVDYKLTWTISTNCVSLSDTVHIQFLSCGLPITDARDGKTYNTLQINDQCWMAQNLNIGVRIPGTNDQTDNGIIEKYCYLNSETNCDVYGGLYQWNEMMQYSTTQGIKGICPTGWHIPSDAEWTNFSDYVKSQPSYLCSNYVNNISKALASTSNWITSSTTCAIGNNLLANNATGFSAQSGGLRTTDSGGSFFDQGTYGYWWSSSLSSTSYSYHRYLKNSSPLLSRDNEYKVIGFSVRCIKDN